MTCLEDLPSRILEDHILPLLAFEDLFPLRLACRAFRQAVRCVKPPPLHLSSSVVAVPMEQRVRAMTAAFPLFAALPVQIDVRSPPSDVISQSMGGPRRPIEILPVAAQALALAQATSLDLGPLYCEVKGLVPNSLAPLGASLASLQLHGPCRGVDWLLLPVVLPNLSELDLPLDLQPSEKLSRTLAKLTSLRRLSLMYSSALNPALNQLTALSSLSLTHGSVTAAADGGDSGSRPLPWSFLRKIRDLRHLTLRLRSCSAAELDSSLRLVASLTSLESLEVKAEGPEFECGDSLPSGGLELWLKLRGMPCLRKAHVALICLGACARHLALTWRWPDRGQSIDSTRSDAPPPWLTLVVQVGPGHMPGPRMGPGGEVLGLECFPPEWLRELSITLAPRPARLGAKVEATVALASTRTDLGPITQVLPRMASMQKLRLCGFAAVVLRQIADSARSLSSLTELSFALDHGPLDQDPSKDRAGLAAAVVAGLPLRELKLGFTSGKCSGAFLAGLGQLTSLTSLHLGPADGHVRALSLASLPRSLIRLELNKVELDGRPGPPGVQNIPPPQSFTTLAESAAPHVRNCNPFFVRRHGSRARGGRHMPAGGDYPTLLPVNLPYLTVLSLTECGLQHVALRLPAVRDMSLIRCTFTGRVSVWAPTCLSLTMKSMENQPGGKIPGRNSHREQPDREHCSSRISRRAKASSALELDIATPACCYSIPPPCLANIRNLDRVERLKVEVTRPWAESDSPTLPQLCPNLDLDLGLELIIGEEADMKQIDGWLGSRHVPLAGDPVAMVPGPRSSAPGPGLGALPKLLRDADGSPVLPLRLQQESH